VAQTYKPSKLTFDNLSCNRRFGLRPSSHWFS